MTDWTDNKFWKVVSLFIYLTHSIKLFQELAEFEKMADGPKLKIEGNFLFCTKNCKQFNLLNSNSDLYRDGGFNGEQSLFFCFVAETTGGISNE